MEKLLTCAIVDDEIFSVETIRLLIDEYCPNVNVLWSADSYDEAWKLLDQKQPDILFLDIEMPGKSGFDLLRDYSKRTFEVIFITAYDQYAIQAFKYSAVDYLLKPIDIDQLKSAVSRAIPNLKENTDAKYTALQKNISSDYPTKIVLTGTDTYLYLNVDDIVFLDGEGAYTNIFCVDGSKYITSKNLGDIEAILNPKRFFRSHRSQIVAVQHVRTFDKTNSSLRLVGGITALLARRKRQEFFDLMSSIY